MIRNLSVPGFEFYVVHVLSVVYIREDPNFRFSPQLPSLCCIQAQRVSFFSYAKCQSLFKYWIHANCQYLSIFGFWVFFGVFLFFVFLHNFCVNRKVYKHTRRWHVVKSGYIITHFNSIILLVHLKLHSPIYIKFYKCY